MEEYFITLFKTIGIFILGIAAFRIMGSQSVGRLTDFDLVIVIAIGAIIGDVLADNELNPWFSITAIVTLVVVQVITSILAMKYTWFEKLVMGRPIRLIKNGKIIKNGLRRARISQNSLIQELRIKGITSTTNVKEAYMEPAGKLSVVQKKNQ